MKITRNTIYIDYILDKTDQTGVFSLTLRKNGEQVNVTETPDVSYVREGDVINIKKWPSIVSDGKIYLHAESMPDINKKGKYFLKVVYNGEIFPSSGVCYIDLGNSLSEGEVAVIQPITGPKGNTGEPGPAGPKGDTGEPGPAGPKGDVGPAGPKGDTGEPGPAGPKGEPGPAGPKGDTGEQGPKGDTGDTGEQGPKGDVGPAGPKGDTGEQGPKGDTGEPGPAGPKGDTGEQGPKGDTGDTGEQGPKGDVGPAGPKGDTGEQGPKGDTGEPGPAGPKGDVGPAGPKGDTGEQGPKGDTGKQGPVGPAGPKGEDADSVAKVRTNIVIGVDHTGGSDSEMMGKVTINKLNLKEYTLDPRVNLTTKSGKEISSFDPSTPIFSIIYTVDPYDLKRILNDIYDRIYKLQK